MLTKTKAVNSPALLLIDTDIQEDQWLSALPDCEEIIDHAIQEALRHITTLQNVEKPLEISVLLTNDDQIQKLNAEYRGKDKPTNVLSFPQIDWQDDDWKNQPAIMLGDIIIAFETVKRESEEQDKSLKNHFIHMLIHSIVHLCGYDHENDDEAKEMEDLEVQILKDLGIENPYKN